MEKETKKTQLVVIDSSVFVDYLRNYSLSIAFFQSFSREQRGEILFSAVTETELIAGKSCDNNEVRTIILNLLRDFRKIEVDNQIALKAGDLSRKYGTDLPDAIIAATALINKAELLTRNVKDFDNIPDLVVKNPY